MRFGKTLAAAAALTIAGGSIAQAETVRAVAPTSEESEIAGSPGLSQLLVIAIVAGAIFAGTELIDDDSVSS
tara:strand:+ start:4917 stop:5132 length:216 start_codon:yes stop_codon:yes gene_type:complete